MHNQNEKAALAERLRGQKLIIPDLHPVFAHWPCGQNKHYQVMKEVLDKRFAEQGLDEKTIKGLSAMNPALLAARWWPRASTDQYTILADQIVWFGHFDDLIEGMIHDPSAASDLRAATKILVRQSLGLVEPGEGDTSCITNPLVLGFRNIGERVCKYYDEEQRKILVGHFDNYIDSTVLEAQADLSENLPSLKRYWEVRILTSGMGTLLGFTELAANAKLPAQLVRSAAYDTLWTTTVVINSIVNDLISFKKEMKSGSVLSSVAILYQQVDNLDAAVQMSIAHLKILVQEFDRTANMVLSKFPMEPTEIEAVSRIIDTMRMVNTGNLEWSLEAERYGVCHAMTSTGQIELVL
ncbi:terpenoid synthase [Hypoxylon fragiforme]|uniref:terpenoid synthase n=1 Tax=Hypoxylon fragiforme TaxID=63214 RepID=UPI0020C5FA3A|nr:terpenoid synthase [Hypoxylon fragiforme]KAI2607088.1 terpenoid synthase [Hypoxylon fragiforme]